MKKDPDAFFRRGFGVTAYSANDQEYASSTFPSLSPLPLTFVFPPPPSPSLIIIYSVRDIIAELRMYPEQILSKATGDQLVAAKADGRWFAGGLRLPQVWWRQEQVRVAPDLFLSLLFMSESWVRFPSRPFFFFGIFFFCEMISIDWL